MTVQSVVLAIISARGGSKGIPRRNVAVIEGKPLIEWTIKTAFTSSRVDSVIVTTEDAEITDVARKFGVEVPFVRPIHLAQDDTPGMESVSHALDEMQGFSNLNIGDRQRGRLGADSMIDCKPTREDITAATQQLSSVELPVRLRSVRNPNKEGEASEDVVRAFASADLADIIKKTFHDVPASMPRE